MQLLQGDQLRLKIEDGLRSSRKVIILSAYFTESAARLLLDNLPLSSSAKLIVRARPQDILSGATDLKAIRLMYENGIICHLNRSLHAKLYVLDNQIGYIGSANFTSNGLKISGYGNLELSVEIKMTREDLNLINSIIDDSILLTLSKLEALERYITEYKNDSIINDWWDEYLNAKSFDISSGLFIADLPWCNLNAENLEENVKHDKDVFSIGERPDIVSSKFQNSKVFHFLNEILKNRKNNEIYFGSLCDCLHSVIRDDITPYRTDVKKFAANIFSYIEIYAKEAFIVDCPNYSQRLVLKHD